MAIQGRPSLFILLHTLFTQALRVSMEEQRARQEEDAKKAVTATAEETSATRPPGGIHYLLQIHCTRLLFN